MESFLNRIEKKIDVNYHDMGFLYSLSCVAAYKLCGNEKGRKAAVMAADHLLTRYREKGEFIQAWGNVGDPGDYRLIIDCLLNLPLFVLGQQRLQEIRNMRTRPAVIFIQLCSVC